MNRIFWTDAENSAVARECVRLYGDNPARWPKTIANTVKEAQKVLPQERQRAYLKGPSNLKGFLPWLKETPPVRKQTPVVVDDDVGALAGYRPAVAPDDPVPQRRVEVGSMEPPLDASVKDVLSTFIADVLVESVKKLLTNGDIARMLRSLQNGVLPVAVVEGSAAAALVRHNPSPMPTCEPCASKPVYLLCGFKPHQQNQFLQAFPEFHLRFWYAEKPGQGMDTLRAKALTAAAVLFTMEATSHSAVALVQSLGRKIIRVTGGGAAMTSALETLRNQRIPA